MDEIKKQLNEEICREIDALSFMDEGSEQKSAAIDGVATLYKLKIDEAKTELESKTQDQQSKHQRIRNVIDGASIVLPLVFYAFWMKKGFKFEETGTFTSTTFRGLFNKFKPGK